MLDLHTQAIDMELLFCLASLVAQQLSQNFQSRMLDLGAVLDPTPHIRRAGINR